MAPGARKAATSIHRADGGIRPLAVADIRFASEFKRPNPLKALRGVPGLTEMILLRRGNRLPVVPAIKEAFRIIVPLGRGN